jgi:carbamoyl-phosphate synthase large subunit|tara:strand:- start:3377 stop:4441 length:1065 start_codon:yes stop_codon:yes gene_type:complete
MKFKKINILITCSSGKFIYDIVKSLKEIKNLNVKIIGVDSCPKPNLVYLDKQYKIANCNNSKKYFKQLVTICKKEKIKIAIPLSENETTLFSKKKYLLEENKIKTLISNYTIVSNIVDKIKMFEFLERKKIDIGKWESINNIKELFKAVKKLGYPNKNVVLKQRKGTGSRGIIILNNKIKKFKYLLKNRFCGTGNLQSVIKEFKKNNLIFKNLFCMPFHRGDVYDIDCFAINGAPKAVISRLRIYENPLSPTNQGCLLKKNNKIENYIKKIIRAFKIHGPCDFDVVIDDCGKPKLLDGSCRMSGSIGASYAAGYNLPELIVKYLLGKKFKNIFPRSQVRLLPVSRFIKINKKNA